MNAWQLARIEKALSEARSGAPGVPHDEAVRWVESWDTVNELRKPKPRKSK
jgi:predicted transcriptional regulator